MCKSSVGKNTNRLVGKALRLCLLPLAFCLALPRGLHAVCSPGQTQSIPGYTFTVPGPDWYRNESEYCNTAYCVNYFGFPLGGYNEYYGYVGVRNPEYKIGYSCPSGCCYEATSGTLDECPVQFNLKYFFA